MGFLLSVVHIIQVNKAWSEALLMTQSRLNYLFYIMSYIRLIFEYISYILLCKTPRQSSSLYINSILYFLSSIISLFLLIINFGDRYKPIGIVYWTDSFYSLNVRPQLP